MNNGQGYYLSPQRYSFLKNLAYSDSPNSGGAQALLAIITGERFIPESKLKSYTELYKSKITESKIDDLFSIVPNPTNGQFAVLGLKEDTELSNFKVELYSLTGSLVSSFSLPDYVAKTTFQLSNTTRGVYIVRISDKNQILHQEKLVVLD